MNVLTPRERCRRECQRTWAVEHGGGLPGGPFPGIDGEPGDARRCPHGRLWLYDGPDGHRFATWRPLSRLFEPRRAWRARHLPREPTR